MFGKKINKAVESVKAEIKDVCKGLVGELFGDIRDEYKEYHFWSPMPTTIKTLGGDIKQRMVDAAKIEFDSLFEARAKSFIAGEDFIDSVVERIQKKQLTSK